MMLLFLSLALVCSLTVAQQVMCPGEDVSCGEGQTCCFSNDRFTCCDVIDDPRIVPGSPSLTFVNSSDAVTARSSWVPEWDFCPNIYGQKICCDIQQITCMAGSDCCTNNINCCFPGSHCCGNGHWCCPENFTCGTPFMMCYSGTATAYPTAALILAVILTMLVYGEVHLQFMK